MIYLWVFPLVNLILLMIKKTSRPHQKLAAHFFMFKHVVFDRMGQLNGKVVLGKRTIYLCLFAILLLPSCISYKNVPYLQDIDQGPEVKMVAYQPPTIAKNDQIGVYISSEGDDAQKLFGVPISASAAQSNPGFLVDEKGTITIPTMGVLKVEGLTIPQAQKLITEKAMLSVNNPLVSVRLLNFKVSVNGAVAKPGVYNVANEKITILEALTMAGDLDLNGKRENVLVVREDVNGNVLRNRIDLRSKSLFTSPSYYLKNNDYVYVQPDIQKLNRDNNVFRNISFGIGILSAITFVIIRLF